MVHLQKEGSMIMLKIKDINWEFCEFKHTKALANEISSRLKEISFRTEPIVNNEITFLEYEKGKFIMSKNVNKIKLKKGDKRIEKLNRDYLQTHKPTQEQVDLFFKTIFDLLDSLSLKYTMVFEVDGFTKIVTKDSLPTFKTADQGE